MNGSANCHIKEVMDFVILPITMIIVDLMVEIAATIIMKAGTKDAKFLGIKE